MSNTIQSGIYQDGASIPWEDAAPGIQRQLFGYDEKMMLVKVKFEQGAVGTMHQHPHIQVSYVESGSFELTIGGEKKVLQTGDGYFVPSNVLHGCVCLEAGVLIDVFTPLREDFLTGK
ncbi:cupin domain-containing protein [Chitinophaga barathri]|uniref:Cupin domain-containing protein n=1 Tax=Chitinophaga barathri TaxID=1647451 RepID=A0A3N4MD28_9BACT|nr:cupin domain-containing protein [Chitinophaga barathri]RPD41468.1 cupin domain-containing protein [Chitinophaga barathri]